MMGVFAALGGYYFAKNIELLTDPGVTKYTRELIIEEMIYWGGCLCFPALLLIFAAIGRVFVKALSLPYYGLRYNKLIKKISTSTWLAGACLTFNSLRSIAMAIIQSPMIKRKISDLSAIDNLV